MVFPSARPGADTEPRFPVGRVSSGHFLDLTTLRAFTTVTPVTGGESCCQETESITKQEKQQRRSELMRSKALNPPSMLDPAQFCLGKQLLV